MRTPSLERDLTTLHPYYFRPHHFLCANGFAGKGYSSNFVRNFGKIVEQLRGPQGDHTKLIATTYTDSICTACPHKRGNLCKDQDYIAALDHRHAQVLGWQSGHVYSWQAVKERLKTLSDETFDQICAGCTWKDRGLCLQALRALRASGPSPQ